MSEMAFTGERFLSNLDYPGIAYEHWHRYLYASAWVAGKTVLDIASGEGYGSFYLAKTAKHVVGVDISQEAVLHATTHYLSANLEFETGSVTNIPVKGEKIFDVIVSFETIEHVTTEDQLAFLREVKRLLKPGGVFIVSTPNKKIYSDDPKYKNEYHIHEFYLEEFKTFLGNYFSHTEVLGQKIYPASVMWNLDQPQRPWREYRVEQTARGLQPTDTPKSDIYDIAVCSDAPLAGVDNAVLLDLSERIWRLREHQIDVLQQANQELQKNLEEKNAYIERLQAALKERHDKERAESSATASGSAEPQAQIEPMLTSAKQGFDVSIIIPLYNKVEYTQQCLESLAQNTPSGQYEVVLVDNASTDATPEFLKCLEGDVKIIRNEKNEGFVRACNIGAHASTGKYLLFLNNDTMVMPGWLEAMLRLAEGDARIGAIGAKLVYPDGKLQEAGAILFNDGSGWNFGRGDDPARENYNQPAEVDYCSGACLLVRRELFEQLNGFDMRYAPAYYEDTDLCFGIRQLGYKVMYCPDAVIVHFEGITAGTDLQSGFKRYQALHQEVFVQKWKRELQQQEPSPNLTRQIPTTAGRSRLKNLQETAALGLANMVGMNVLVIDPTLPMYDRASGCLRLFSILKILRQQGCAVTFIAREGGQAKYKQELEVMGIRVYGPDPAKMTTAGPNSKGAPLDMIAILGEQFFHVAWLSFFNVAEQYLAEIRRYSPNTKIVIDTVDVHFVRETRQADLHNDAKLRRQAQETREHELAIYQQADALVLVTPDDQRVLEPLVPGKPMFVVPNIHELQPAAPPYHMRSGLLFVGNFNHPPNQDAMLYFTREVLPKVRASLPGIKLYIVGDHPPQVIKNLESEMIMVTGYVPKTEPYLNLSRISIAPLRYGAGMKGKIGEALSHGLPVVTTSVGAEGMGLRHEEHLLIADDAEAFAQAIIRLYNDKTLWDYLAQNGRSYIENTYTPQAIASKVKAVFGLVEEKKREELTSLIVLTHNQVRVTRACLESVFLHTHEPFELIVVDNASTDNTLEYLRSLENQLNSLPHEFCRKFTLLPNSANRGFAGGNNQGMAAARGEYVVLMNNDVVVTPEWLTQLLGCARRDPKVGLVGPMTNYVSGPQKVENPAYRVDSWEGLDEFAQTHARQHAGQAQSSWRVVGFCMLIKRAVIEKIGGLDDRFGLGNFEDDDFSLRAALAGFESWIAQDCYVHHIGSQTFADLKLDYTASLKQNWEIFKHKWSISADLPYGSQVDLSNILQAGFKVKHYCAYQ
jgi:GT2 family glycosyltransferase/SAM-dependent methyltransferase/glycosyltransferase involved in cell wall biosynthesis